MGAISALITPSSNPNLFNTKAMTAIIATTAATIKNIGFIKIVAPSFTNAPPKFFNVVMNPLNPLVRSAGVNVPSVCFKLALCLAAFVKSNFIMDSPIPSIDALA